MPQQINPTPPQKAFIFFGTTASGKSYLAGSWAAANSYVYLNTDAIRKKIAGQPERQESAPGINQGIYSREFTRLTYDTLLNEAEAAILNQAKVVVIDGSYIKRTERDRLMTRLCGLASCLFIHCVCSEATVKARLATRASDQNAVSDGTWEIYLHQQQVLEPPTELPPAQLITLNTERPLAELIAQLNEQLRGKIGTAAL